MLISSYLSVKGNRGKAVRKCLQGERNVNSRTEDLHASVVQHPRRRPQDTTSRTPRVTFQSVFGFKALAKNTFHYQMYVTKCTLKANQSEN